MAMPQTLGASELPVLQAALADGLSSVDARRRHGEAVLQAAREHPGFCSCLAVRWS